MENFQIRAFNIYDSIAIKAIKSALSGQIIDSTPNEIQLKYGDNSYLFVFRFGALVAFNVDDAMVQREREQLTAILGPELVKATAETYEIQLGAQDNVEFEYVELKDLKLTRLRLIALTLGQSAALEYFEVDANRMLQETTDLMQRMGKKGSPPFASKKLLQFIGSAAANRQHIFSNLAVLDPPDETWTNEELQKLFGELQQNFDINVRFRTLDRKLSLVQDNIEILANLVAARRTAWLEALVAVLILVELALGIMREV